tara:strand:- start:1213 stop:1572 length:360 start_codon:yes stop_codon:yes gene_type:complete
MGIFDKFTDVWEGVSKAGTGVSKVLGGDWGGFRDVYSGVSSLFQNKDAFSKITTDPYMRPNVSLMGYKVDTTKPGAAGSITQFGDTDRIPDWSRNQAVAMYYLDMINKITKQGSPRKGA